MEKSPLGSCCKSVMHCEFGAAGRCSRNFRGVRAAIARPVYSKSIQVYSKFDGIRNRGKWNGIFCICHSICHTACALKPCGPSTEKKATSIENESQSIQITYSLGQKGGSHAPQFPKWHENDTKTAKWNENDTKTGFRGCQGCPGQPVRKSTCIQKKDSGSCGLNDVHWLLHPLHSPHWWTTTWWLKQPTMGHFISNKTRNE